MLDRRLLPIALALFLLPLTADAQTTVYYHTGWSRPHIHFDAGSGWTQPPGSPMQGVGGGWHRVRLASNVAKVTFNNGTNTWDPGSGGSYAVQGPEAWIKGGVVYARRPDPGRIEHHVVASGILNRSRNVWVYLPAGYDPAASTRYPVLYLHDGNNMFDPGAPFGGWAADTTLDELIAKGEMAPIIAVAVSNTGARMEEYTPTRDPLFGGGQGDAYLDFLEQELKPFIDGQYRTRTGPAHTGVLGSSLGGLISFYASWSRPNVFGLCGAMSPSFWWDSKVMLRQVQAHRGARPDARFYLDSGDSGNSQDGLATTEDMRDLLEQLGYQHGADLGHYVDRGASHNEVYWRNRLAIPLKFLFPVTTPSGPAPVAVRTIIRVHYNVGVGHHISLRGDAPGWNAWNQAMVATWTTGNVWVYETTAIPQGIRFEFKALIDGVRWQVGGNQVAVGGQTVDVRPIFR